MANRNIENLICEKFGSKVIYRSKDHNKRNKRMGHDYDNDKIKWYNYTEPKNYLILLKNGMVIEVMQKSHYRVENTVRNKKGKIINKYVVDRYKKPSNSMPCCVLSRFGTDGKRVFTDKKKTLWVEKFLKEANTYFNRKVNNIDK